MNRRQAGARGEELARAYLESRGMRCLDVNVHVGAYELDLIMLDGETIVFVEVKMRTNTSYGRPLEGVTRKKIRALSNGAVQYAARTGRMRHPMRFDVVGVSFMGDTPRFEHVKNAFPYTGDSFFA